LTSLNTTNSTYNSAKDINDVIASSISNIGTSMNNIDTIPAVKIQ